MSDFEEYYVDKFGELEFRKMFGKTLLDYAILIQLIKKHFSETNNVYAGNVTACFPMDQMLF